jgi:hypothetical protein
MSDEIRNAIVEEGERLPAGTGNAHTAMERGKRRLFLKRASYGALSVVVVGAGWLGTTQVVGDDDPTFAVVGGDNERGSVAPEPRQCPNETQPGLIIDWSNFIQFHGITYQENYYERRKLSKDLLGEVYAEVECTIQDHVGEGYEIQDRDAAFLEPGTKVYEMLGYEPSFRLVARWNGDYVIYEADTNPEATVGEDLLDIRNKVDYISVERDGGKRFVSIHTAQKVERFTRMVLEAPVDQDKNIPGDDNVFLTFHLKDGTGVTRAVSLGSDIMSRGIQLPPGFVEMLEEAGA